jgi:hypothetical protein
MTPPPRSPSGELVLSPGETVTLQRVTRLSKYHHLAVDEVVVTVTRWRPEYNLLVGHERSRFSYTLGFRERGTDTFARNPYDDQGEWRENCFAAGGTNGYLVECYEKHPRPEGQSCSDWNPVDWAPAGATEPPPPAQPLEAPAESCLLFAREVHRILSDAEWSANTPCEIAEAMQNVLGWDIAEPS